MKLLFDKGRKGGGVTVISCKGRSSQYPRALRTKLPPVVKWLQIMQSSIEKQLLTCNDALRNRLTRQLERLTFDTGRNSFGWQACNHHAPAWSFVGRQMWDNQYKDWLNTKKGPGPGTYGCWKDPATPAWKFGSIPELKLVTHTYSCSTCYQRCEYYICRGEGCWSDEGCWTFKFRTGRFFGRGFTSCWCLQSHPCPAQLKPWRNHDYEHMPTPRSDHCEPTPRSDGEDARDRCLEHRALQSFVDCPLPGRLKS